MSQHLKDKTNLDLLEQETDATKFIPVLLKPQIAL